MTTDIQPRIDEHGVGWCSEGKCPHFALDSIDNDYCNVLGEDDGLLPADGICEPWARAAAKDYAAMEAIRASRCDFRMEGYLTGMFIRAFISGRMAQADDPADAVLKAAEEKR